MRIIRRLVSYPPLERRRGGQNCAPFQDYPKSCLLVLKF